MGTRLEIIEQYAPTMGTFTTKQMASVVFGTVNASTIHGTYERLCKLRRRGQMEKAGRALIDGTWQMTWRWVA